MRSNFGKEFAFYIPYKFEEAKDYKYTNKQLGFYWINGDQLVTVRNGHKPWFMSNDGCLLSINGMTIYNNRNE